MNETEWATVTKKNLQNLVVMPNKNVFFLNFLLINK